MKQTRIAPMVEGGVLSAVSIVFALISVYVPVIGTFVNLIWPVPIILLGVRHGYKWSILSTVVAGLIISILMHPLQAVGVVVGFGLIGIVLGYAIRSEFSPVKSLVWGSVASFISKGAVLLIGTLMMGFNPLDMQTDAMINSIDQILAIYRKMGLKEEDLAKMADNMRQMFSMVKIIMPAGFAVASIVDTYINFVAAKAVLKKLGHYIPAFPPFKEWMVPRYALLIYIVSIMGIVFGTNKPELAMLYNIGVNLNVIASVLMIIQGLAVFYYLADKYNLSKVVRGVILFLIFSNGFLTQVLIWAGMFDIAFDYRKLRMSR